MAEKLDRSKTDASRYSKVVSVTGSLEITTAEGRPFESVHHSLKTSSASVAAAAVQITHEINPATPHIATIHCWKEDSGTDRVAATSAVDVSVLAFVK